MDHDQKLEARSTNSGALQPERHDTVRDYAIRIKRGFGKSVSAILETAAIIAEAHAALDYSSFSKLAEAVNLSRATLNKFMTIYSRCDRLEACAEALPPKWTTVYELSRLSDEQFDDLASSGKLKSTLTEKDLARHRAQQNRNVTPAGPSPEQRANLVVKVTLPALLSPGRKDGIRRKIIEAVGEEPDVVVRFSDRRFVRVSRG